MHTYKREPKKIYEYYMCPMLHENISSTPVAENRICGDK
jgi:hypothetical protein